MKKFSIYGLLFAILSSSCHRGIYITIDNKKYDYGKNTVVTFKNLQGIPPSNMFNISTYKKSVGDDSSFFVLTANRANIPITAGDYSYAQKDTANFSVFGISFYDNNRNRYVSAWNEDDPAIFVITSLGKMRAKGYFKAVLEDIKADTSRPENRIYVEGRFNVPLKNARRE